MHIIILPGWGHSSDIWKSVAQKLGKNTAGIDMPGFGKKMLVNSNWGIPDYAKWVEGKIDTSKNTVLIGHSFGGRVAAEIASRRPRWLKGLVLAGAPCLYRPSLKTRLKINLNKNLKHIIPAGLRQRLLTGELKEAGIMKMEKIFRNAVKYDQTNKLKKINSPTLLIWGGDDNDVPLRIANEMKGLIKKSNLKIIEGAGHNSFLDNPNLFFGYVKNFTKNI
ncbi:MAG: alpha/beta hydrolase [bacterium]|nr:alpha/beta hydrolase [bacterium]